MALYWLRNTNCYTLDVGGCTDAWRQRLVWEPAGTLHAFRCIEDEVLDSPGVQQLVAAGLLAPAPEHHARVMREDLGTLVAAYVERFRPIVPDWMPETAPVAAPVAAPVVAPAAPSVEEAPSDAAPAAPSVEEAPAVAEAPVEEAPVEAPVDAPADPAADSVEGTPTSVLPSGRKRR